MKTIKLFTVAALTLLTVRLAHADLVGNYTPDANTLFLLHFDEPAGTSTVTNYGTKGGFFYTVVNSVSGNGVATPPTTTAMLGQPAYVNGATNFNSCLTNPAAGDLAGYDFNQSGSYDGDVSSSTLSPDRLAVTNLNIGLGGQSPFTIEALIRPTTVSANEEIVCTDSSAATRAFQFRITGGTLQFQFINGSKAISGTIPTTGNDAFLAGNWYHVAISYDGATATLYWTLLNPTNGAAHTLSSSALALGTTQGGTSGPLIIGNENRNSSAEQFQGCIDEVRISSVARGSGQMQFYSPLVTIAANPVSQNVDYNQPVTFTVGASSQFPLGYRWRFNSNSIAGATNTSYAIANVAAGNAGYYDCVVTNSIGSAATSSPALLVVGAANFLADRYSFTTDTSDSVGGQWGTNFGNATVTGGQLVLDGTSGTFMQLPGKLYNGASATALTFEFWATFGTNPNNVYAFAFGVTNFVIGQGIVGFNHAMYSPHNAGGQTASATPGDPLFSQTANAPGNLDGTTVHVAVVFDPPNKLLSIYTNGILEAVNTNFTVPISGLNDQFSYIGRSLWAADPYLNASIDELRIFKGALSSISIKQSQDQGPNTLLADGPAVYALQPVGASVPAGQTAAFTVATVGYLPITYQWFKNSLLVPGATNALYSFVTSIGDNGSTIFCHATNTIGVTTYVTNSASVTLNVFIPPTLAWIDAADGGSGDATWNTTSLNWKDTLGGGPIAFAQTNGVLFDVRGAGSPSVDLAQATTPYNVTVNSASDYLIFSSSALGSLYGQGGLTKQNSGRLTIDVTNNLSGPVTVSGGILQVGNNDSLGSLGSGIVTNNSTISLNRNDAALNVGNTIHGTGALSVDGTGAVTLSGNNDYAGATLINSGIVFLGSANGLGSIAAGTTVASGAQLYVTANVNLAEGLTISGTGDGNGALRKGGAGQTVQTASIALAADSTIGVDTGATLVVSNAITGNFNLTASGGGTLALTANSALASFTLNGPVVNLSTAGALGANPINVSGAGRFVLADGITLANAVNASSVSPGAATGLLMVNDNTNGTITTLSGPLTFQTSPATGGDFQGPLSSGYLNILGPITNTATGVVTSRNGFVRFSGGGDYTLFTLNQGTAILGANNGICPATSLAMGASAGATLDLAGFNQTLTGISDAAANTDIVTNSAATSSVLTLDLVNGGSFSGIIAGNLALVLNGAGFSLTLNATNSYRGNTTVNAGTLELVQPALATNSTVTIAAGGTLQLDFATSNTVAGLVLSGAAQAGGLYNSTTSPTWITGVGSLLVVPQVSTTPATITTAVNGGVLTLTWPADHTGWRLQVQTNSLSSGLGANWVNVPGASSSNSNSVPINRTSGAVFYRIVYP